jgi:molybdopterin molybdotransferase
MVSPAFRACPVCGTRNKLTWESCAQCGESLAEVAVSEPGTGARPAVRAGLVAEAGGELVTCVTVPDDPTSTVDALATALDGADLVVTTGGVSVGTHDHVRPALAALEVEEVFWGVRIRPGHPTWLGRRGHTPVLALPGNPVASVVCFWVFGRPLLGCDDPWTAHRLGADYAIATPRTDLIRCTQGPDGLVPVDLQASHHISGLARASHLAAIDAGRGDLRKGESVGAVSLRG